MGFTKFKEVLQSHFEEMTKDESHLFEVEIDKDELWAVYLNSFPEGTNELYRERTEHDCSCCRHFIRTIGNAVVIKDGEIFTIWDLSLNDTTYQPVADALNAYVKSFAVTNIWISKEKRIGTDFNHEQLDTGKIIRWDHFYIELPNKFVDSSSRSEGDIKGGFRDTRNVFKSSLDGITEDSVHTILELISQNSLYKGEEWKGVLTEFLKYKREYDNVENRLKDNYAWEQSVRAGSVIGRIKNHSIGTLLINISEGMDLDTAVKKYEQIVAPNNYKRPKAIFTKKMLEDAKKVIEELGYMDSLGRRHATLDDITVNNILFSNKDSAKRIDGADVFAELGQEVSMNPKKFSKIEEISAEKFLSEVLPTVKEIDVFLENKNESNMVSLIAPEIKDSKTMFKWNNNYGWAYSGNVTDSMRERVKAAGGRVDGDLRFSIQWNEDGGDNCDLDAHCKESSGFKLYFGSAKKPNFSPTKGQLDVDIIHPEGKIAVENITWADRNIMNDGMYLFFVHQFSGSANHGFRAEIEFDGQLYSFEYNKSMRSGEKVQVAEIILANRQFTIKELLPSTTSSREIWNLHTNQFVPVSVVMFSPNYWDEQNGIGHRHVFFMLKDCINTESPNGYYNEFLKNELSEHKRVFEALGSKCHVKDSDDQLSGVGFSMTQHADLIVKVKGATERIVKIKF